MFQGGDLEQAGHSHQHDGGQHRLGQRGQQVREEKHHHQNDPRREGARQRRARAPAFVDERLRHAAADRETAAQSGGEIGRGEREEFLVGVQPPAMFGGEHAANRGRLHRAKQKTGERQRQQLVQVGPVNRGEAEGRQPLRHFAQQLHPARFEAEPARSHDAADHHEQRHGFVLEKNLSRARAPPARCLQS